MDILNYYRKFIEKSRSFCARFAAGVRDCFRAFVKKAGFFCAKFAAGVQNCCRAFVKKSRSFCAAHLNIGRTDVFVVIAVSAVLGYIAVNRSCEAVNGPDRIIITIPSRCGDLFGKEAVAALIQEFEGQNPNLRIQEITKEADNGGVARSADIVFFDDSEYGSLKNATSRALVSFMDLFIYNIDILQAANLDRPPKTRAEFLAAAKAVAESGPASGPVSAFALGLSPADPLALRREIYPWLWANGVDIRSIDLSGDNPAFPRAVTETIAFFGQLNRDERLAPGTFETTGARRLQEFAEGKIAMMTVSARDLAFLKNSARGITFGITALPAITQGKNRIGLSGIYAGISVDCAIPEEARVFLSFLAKKNAVLAEALSAVPGSYPDVFAGEYITQDPLYSKAWEIFEAAEIVDYKPGEPSEEAFYHLLWEKLVEALKVEPPKAEPPKVEPPRVEAPKAEPPKAEPPKEEAPRAEPPAESPKAETPE